MDDTVFQAALAGLLHDIGKFAQRAAEGLKIPWSEDENSDIKKRYRHQHALYTDQVVEQIVPDKWRQEVRAASGHHHNPQTHLERVVALADHLSAGERSEERKDHPKQLQSIFCSISGLQNNQPSTAKYLPLKKLEIKREVIFPVDQIDDSYGTYEALWRDFERDARVLKEAHQGDQANPLTYPHSLVDLMQRYTWCIPSAYYRSVPDVSLYDHSRMTAALAACLVGQPEDKVQGWLEKKNLDEPVALLVGGDISGVQKFIYTITSSGAAKSLRGRSFYLQMLTEVVARYVLNQLDLPITNLIYAGGGNFFLLAGVNQQQKLLEVSRSVTRILLDTHDGSLHLVMAHHAISSAGFEHTKFHKEWDTLHQTLNQAKLQPLSSLEQNMAQEVGTGLGVGGDVDSLCRVCGRETSQTVATDSGGEVIRICYLCQSMADLGNQLAKATHLIFAYVPPRPHLKINQWWQGLELFGVNIWPVNANLPLKPGERYLKGLPPDLEMMEISTLPLTAKYEASLYYEVDEFKATILKSIRLFAQLVAKDNDGFPLTFDELANNKTDTAGIPLPIKEGNQQDNVVRWSGLQQWGVLRMDVDNLGRLFREGFVNKKGENNLTLSRMASLSFALRLFFEGWLPELGRRPETSARLRNRLYVQYAGGDDLFVVGSWDALPEFAATIRASLAEYVCQNPAITLSGGVTLAPEKYPLYQAADDAEQAEKIAKHYRSKKDTFCFLGLPIGWEEFEPVMKLAYNLADWCGNQELVSRALLQTLLAIYAEYEDGRQEALRNGKWRPGQMYYGPWRWHLAYQLGRRIQEISRRIDRNDTPPELRRQLEEIRAQLRQIERDMLEQRKIETIGLAARWAQYLIRQ